MLGSYFKSYRLSGKTLSHRVYVLSEFFSASKRRFYVKKSPILSYNIFSLSRGSRKISKVKHPRIKLKTFFDQDKHKVGRLLSLSDFIHRKIPQPVITLHGRVPWEISIKTCDQVLLGWSCYLMEIRGGGGRSRHFALPFDCVHFQRLSNLLLLSAIHQSSRLWQWTNRTTDIIHISYDSTGARARTGTKAPTSRNVWSQRVGRLHFRSMILPIDYRHK